MNSENDNWEIDRVSEINVITLAEINENTNNNNNRKKEEENEQVQGKVNQVCSTTTCTKRKLPNYTDGDETASANSQGESGVFKKIKNEESDITSLCSTEASSGSTPLLDIHIKKEPKEEHVSADEYDKPQPSCSGVTNPQTEVKPLVKVEKAYASSTTSRESCLYGIRCYRQNPMHRIEEAHPGDQDYKRPNYPAPPLGTPQCPYGNRCYRRNPEHFRHFSHPPETNFEMNYRIRLSQRKRRRRRQSRNDNQLPSNNSSEDDYDTLDDGEDPFADDDDEDYVPSGDDLDDEDETEDFMADYDDCDKVEE